MILTCAKIQRKVLIFGAVGALESSFLGLKLHDYRSAHFVNIKLL